MDKVKVQIEFRNPEQAERFSEVLIHFSNFLYDSSRLYSGDYEACQIASNIAKSINEALDER